MTGKLELPSSLLVIGDRAFSGTGFTGELVLPDGLESIGDSSFSGCTGITSIKAFPDTLQHIKSSAFYGCSSLGGEITIPDSVTAIGEDAFRDCPKLSGVTFGKNLCSIGEGAFANCEALKTAVITENIPDFYGSDEKYPSFPDGCALEAPDSAIRLSDSWKAGASRPVPGKEEKDDSGVSREEPYYWTMSLVGSEFTGAGSFSDVVLYFDDSIINVRINGRELQTVPYSADQNADEDDQVVSTEGFFCRDGWVTELKYSPGFNSDDQLSGTLLKEDGSSEEVIFHTGSEECLYL